MSEDLEDITRNEIAKRFVLPERQSKIRTLLRQDKQVCCKCKSSDNSSTNISCENCEDTFHVICAGLSEGDFKFIKQYFCEKCTNENPSLKTRWKKNSPNTEPKPRKKSKNENKNIMKAKKCGDCMGCNRTEDCGKCNVCIKKQKHKACKKKERCIQRICINYCEERHSSSDTETAPMAHLMTDYPRQCYGPNCTKSARYGSKYCSDECGINLANARILQILPQRLQGWNLTPCVAEKKNIETLEQVRKQRAAVTLLLQELDKKEQDLIAIIERAKTLTIDENLENDQEEESEMSMYCVTCGYEIHSKTAIKHMEKCFIKYESQTSFGSIYECKIEGNTMFCDYYNSTNKTYCKKLRVICPEHSKDPRIGDDEVCGCPLMTDCCSISENLCRAPKKSCTKHYVWEKKRRAEIDLERIRYWLKIDELMEKERNIRTSMANRAGVLGLMLHSTYNHDIMDPIKKNGSHN